MKRRMFYVYKVAKFNYKANSTYVAATILKFLTNFLVVLVYVFLWKAIYSNENSLMGYSYEEMVSYILLTRILQNLYPYHISKLYGNLVVRGDITNYLLKPISIEWNLLGIALGRNMYNFVYTGIPYIFIFCILNLSLKLTANGILLFVLYYLCSYIFIFLLEINIGILSYYFENLWGVSKFKDAMISLVSGELLPICFYPLEMIGILNLLPFSTVYYKPITILLNSQEIEKKSFFILLISICISFFIYRCTIGKIIKKIAVSGG